MPLLGETFALITAVFWAFGSLLFSFAGRRVGAFSINVIRIPIAAFILIGLCFVVQGRLITETATTPQVLWLVLSAFFGLVVGDWCYFKSLVILGPRVGSLLAASTPIFAVVISWIWLRETLGWLDLTGILVTLSGLGWVTLERKAKPFGAREGSKTTGYLLAAIGACGQAAGLVTAKIGLGDNVSSLSGTMVRMVSASIMVWVVVVILGRFDRVRKAVLDRKALLAMIGAAMVGPVFGVWLSLLSIRYTQIGIAATLMSTTPLWVIPLVMIIHSERPSARAMLGTVVAVVGVAILFLF